MSLFLILLLAHLLGDFVLQFDFWVKDKQTRKLKSPFLYLHILIHFGLIIIIGWDLNLWEVALLVSVLHFVIDVGKLYISSYTTKKQWPFFVDQFLHILIIGAIAFYGKAEVLLQLWNDSVNLKIVIAYVFLSLPVSIIMQKLLIGWDFEDSQDASLPKAGKVIGVLERILVLTFILLDHWEAIGFLITAKSVFRFNDLKSSDRKLTEYILIGTLLSFGIAILTGVVVKTLF